MTNIKPGALPSMGRSFAKSRAAARPMAGPLGNSSRNRPGCSDVSYPPLAKPSMSLTVKVG